MKLFETYPRPWKTVHLTEEQKTAIGTRAPVGKVMAVVDANEKEILEFETFTGDGDQINLSGEEVIELVNIINSYTQ
jgi:hypothetical protein